MLLTIQAEQAEQIIPDANSAKSAKKLAKIKDWNNIAGSEDQWIWGEITGSAIYQSAVFLPELKCECSCPSFKRPCKHALALLLVYVDNQDHFNIQTDESAIPERVQKWREKKSKSVEKKEKAVDKPVDEEARAKRQLAREKKMQEGIDALQVWLNDSVTMGLARLRQNNASIKQMSSRLVDAQAAGLNAYLDELSSALYQENWQTLTAFWLAKLQLAVNLWQNRQHLPNALHEELKQLLGVNLPTDAWAKIPSQSLNVYALGQVIEDLNNTRGRYRRQWLWDADQLQEYLLLDFEIPPYSSFGLTLGYQKSLELHAKFYPVVSQQRIRLDDQQIALQTSESVTTAPKGVTDFHHLLQRYADGLKQNPLQLTRFFWINNVRIIKHAKEIYLTDQNNHMMPLNIKRYTWTDLWFLVAGEQFSAGLEWDGLELKLVSIWQGAYFECQ